jgi:hypothetical protein
MARDVVREQLRGPDQLLAARLELAHEQGAGQPQLPVDLVACAGAGRRGRDEETRRQDGDEQPHDDRPRKRRKSTTRTCRGTLRGSRQRRRDPGSTPPISLSMGGGSAK